jgi:hypothetical protein
MKHSRALPFALITISIFGHNTAVAQVQVKNEIAFYRYRNDPSGDIRGLLCSRIQNELLDIASRYSSLKSLERYAMRQLDNPPPLEVNGIREIWQKSNYLALFSGDVLTDPGSHTVIVSDIYLGSYRTDHSDRAIKCELPYVRDQVINLHDSHILVTLYALAMDAKATKLPGEAVLALLAEAQTISNDLKRRDSMQGDVAMIASAVDKEFASLKETNK